MIPVFKPIEFDGELREQYWEGKSNTFVRYWAYLRGGLALVNEAKNYLLVVFGSFWTAKVIEVGGHSINPNWTLLAGLIGVPILILLGRWQLHKAAKPQEFMNTSKGTVIGYQAFNLQVSMLELQENILKELKRLNGTKKGN